MTKRSEIVNQAKKWLGLKESNLTHREIVDVYNSHKPLARGYKLKYNDAWCAGFVSAVAIKCKATKIIPTEVGCGQYITLLKKMGIWVESDSYVPSPGDIILYDWKDNGVGENKDGASHIGYVLSVSNKVMKVIEGNLNNSVAIREIKVNARYIRGFGTPKYESETSSKPSETIPKPSKPSESKVIHKVLKGDNLSKVAKKYKTSVTKIYNNNKKLIDSENKKRGVDVSKKWIYPGQKLVIK